MGGFQLRSLSFPSGPCTQADVGLREDGILGELFAVGEGCLPTPHVAQPSLQARSVPAAAAFPTGKAEEPELIEIYPMNSLTYQH